MAFLAAVFAAGSVVMIGLTSFTGFDPPGWLRIASMAPLPLAIIASVGFGLAGLGRGSGRAWAIAGFSLTGLAVVAFILMISLGG